MAILFFFLSAIIPYPAEGFGIKEEKELGEKLLSLVSRQFAVIEEPDVVEYINTLGHKIVRASGPTFFNFHFFVIDDREFNAFAAPSGLIFVHSGLIAGCRSEDELVAVLAHEIGHVQSRHIAHQMEKSTKVGIGTLALMIAGIAVGAGPIGNALVAGSMATNASLALKFSRKDEEEADRLAYNWMGKMGRDRRAILSMLQRMRRISVLQSGDLPQYLLSHPITTARIGYIQDLLRLDGPLPPHKDKDDFAFQRFRLRIMALSHSLSGGIGLESASRDGRGNREGLKNYGLALNSLEQGDYNNAEKRLKKAITDFPGRPDIITDLGLARFRAGRLAAARKTLEQSRKIKANAYNTFYLARTMEEQGDCRGAIDLYRRTEETLSFSANLHLHQGLCLDSLGSHGAARYHLGLNNWYRGQGKAAIRELKKAVKLMPKNAPLRRKAEEALARIKHLEKVKT